MQHISTANGRGGGRRTHSIYKKNEGQNDVVGEHGGFQSYLGVLGAEGFLT